MNQQKLIQAWKQLPSDAPESIVGSIFLPPFIESLGFEITESIAQYPTGQGADKVDYALRHNTQNNIFINTKQNPHLLIEVKGRDINLNPDAAQYHATVKQLKRYLLAPNCKTVKWGIIINADFIQVFRKHGKVIYPATPCINLNFNNLVETINKIKQIVDHPPKALTIAVYNNKGGVGKTTTTVNLAALLTLKGKKTLLIDFDPNQRDLTQSLGLEPNTVTLCSCLLNREQSIEDAIKSYEIKSKKTGKICFRFDVVPVDHELANTDETTLRKNVKTSRLSKLLEKARTKYDYILIDAPPNWRFFSASAVYAADVVLIPTKHNNVFSLRNAAIAIHQFIAEVQIARGDAGPIALPIFFNGEKMTDPQKMAAHKAIDEIITQVKKQHKFDLLPYFYPLFTKTTKSRDIFELPNYAHIANAAFETIPAVCKNKVVQDYYSGLAQEYFLQ